MLVVGAGGLALQMLDDLLEQFSSNLRFYISEGGFAKQPIPKELILEGEQNAKEYLKKHPEFSVAINDAALRRKSVETLTALGGTYSSMISRRAFISSLAAIEQGVIILANSLVEPAAKLATGVVVNVGVTITHEVNVGQYATLSPGTYCNGASSVGENSFLGAGAILLPGVQVGSNCIVGAGAVVIKHVADNMKVVGLPAR